MREGGEWRYAYCCMMIVIKPDCGYCCNHVLSLQLCVLL